jgi:hypothetical protein
MPLVPANDSVKVCSLMASAMPADLASFDEGALLCGELAVRHGDKDAGEHERILELAIEDVRETLSSVLEVLCRLDLDPNLVVEVTAIFERKILERCHGKTFYHKRGFAR